MNRGQNPRRQLYTTPQEENDSWIDSSCQGAYAQPLWDEPVADEPAWEDMPPAANVIATNRTVCMTCMLESMLSLLALFLLIHEKRSHAIRHFAVQSLGLAAVHVVMAMILALVGLLTGGIPFVGMIMTLVCWLCYLAAAVVMLVARYRMMACAWQGIRFVLPVIGLMLERFV